MEKRALATAGGELPTLRDAIEAAKGADPACYDMDKVWELADLLEPLDPAETGWNVEIAEAAMILFGDIRLGPEDHAVQWLWYVQNTTTSLLGPWDGRTLAANSVLAHRCWTLGLYDEAAAAWQAVIVAQEHRDDPDAADEARIDRAACLYGLGRCREAITLLKTAWGLRLRTGRAGRRVGAALPLVHIEMLRLCGHHNHAQTVWQAVSGHLPDSILLRQGMVRTYGQVLDARTHRARCTFGVPPAELRRAGGQTRRALATTAASVGGCAGEHDG
ncbi:hypothetical protein [Actinoplanes sp. NPDC020271]|uniref:hypothetical protein n=1 Tax=Actinoplanes sp. NPDC020271 TaxID=3363896 RepID=UPI0037B38C6B